LRWLVVAVLAIAPLGCNDETVAPPPAIDAASDARVAGDGGASSDASSDVPASAEPIVDCFKGTAKTNEELLNACWPETVTSFVKKPNLPGGYLVGMPLPPPPP
jgi:hypothetical protein